MLKSFSLANIKSYYERCIIDFAIPSEDQNGLTILVGKNNAGKSSILSTLSACFDYRPNVVFDKMDRHQDADPFLEVKYKLQGVDQTLSLSTEARAWFKKRVIIDHSGDEPDYQTVLNHTHSILAYVPSRRPWEDTFQGGGGGAHDLKGFEQQREAIYEQSRLGNRQLERLGDQLNQIIQKNEKDAFNQLLKSILPDLSDWTTDRVAGQDRIMYVSASGAEHAIRDVGDGVTSIFRLCFALHSYPKEVTLLLDEPELSLHPDGQRRLYETLRKYSRERQIIIATHSPHCIDWSDLVKGTKIYRIAQDADGHSFASSASQDVLNDVYKVAHRDYKNRKLFAYLAKEDRDQSPLPLFSYGAGGAPHIIKWIRLARELGLTVAALYDHDSAKEAEQAILEFANDKKVRVVVSPYDDIRDKTDKATGKVTKEGFFSEDWEVKPERANELLELLEDIRMHLESYDLKISRFVFEDANKVVKINDRVRR